MRANLRRSIFGGESRTSKFSVQCTGCWALVIRSLAYPPIRFRQLSCCACDSGKKCGGWGYQKPLNKESGNAKTWERVDQHYCDLTKTTNFDTLRKYARAQCSLENTAFHTRAQRKASKTRIRAANPMDTNDRRIAESLKKVQADEAKKRLKRQNEKACERRSSEVLDSESSGFRVLGFRV